MQLEAARLVDPVLGARRWLARLRGDGATVADVAAEDGVPPAVVRQHVVAFLRTMLHGEDLRTPALKAMDAALQQLAKGKEISSAERRATPAWLLKPAARGDNLPTFHHHLAGG